MKTWLHFVLIVLFFIFMNWNLSYASPLNLPKNADNKYSSLSYIDKAFEKDKYKFLGGMTNINSASEGLVSSQIIRHMSQPAEPFAERLDDGDWIFSGTLPHAAQTKGAVLTDSYGKIKAAALLEFVGQRNLEPEYQIWIYVYKSSANNQAVSDIDEYLNSNVTEGAEDAKTPKTKVFYIPMFKGSGEPHR